MRKVGGRLGAASAAGRAAPPPLIRCAFLNANGLFSTHGEIRPSWVPLSACLHVAEFDAFLLTEVHLQPTTELPADGAFHFCAAPAVERRAGRRDAAIAINYSAPGWCALPGSDVDVSGVSLTSARPQIHLISAYAPDTSRGPAARADFFDRLEAALHRWHAEDPSIVTVLAMDANTWDPSLDPSRRGSPDLPRLHAILRQFNLTVLNTPGQATHRSGTVIDWVATNSPDAVDNLRVHSAGCSSACNLWPACFPALGSDHCLITFDLRCAPPPAPCCTARPRLLCCDWDAGLETQVAKINDLSRALQASSSTSQPAARQLILDAAACSVYQIAWAAAESQGAVRSRSSTRTRRRGCRWWTAECQAAWVARQRAHAAFRLDGSPSAREAHRVARNHFAHTVARAQQQGFAELLGGLEDLQEWDQRLAARRVRQECSQGGGGPPPCMRSATGLLTAVESLQGWADHLGGVGPAAPPAWRACLEDMVQSTQQNFNGMAARPVTVIELRQAAEGARPNSRSAPGIDGLPYAPFMAQHPAWERLLCALFSLALQWGMVPRLWTIGEVVPLFKGGSPMEFDSWRPITLLSCLGKLFEHIMLRRLAPLLLPSIASTQAGFRYGADEHAFALVEAVRALLAARPRSRPLVAFIDIRKAFDVVWREGLLWKLWCRGARGAEWQAVAALLNPSTSFARTPHGHSPPWASLHGVRQGSILSPLLFLIYIDDLAHALLEVPGISLPGFSITALLYADDIAIVAETPEALQAALDVASAWAESWRATFGTGPSKSAVICFRGGASQGESPFRLAGRTLPWVSQYRYLGVVVDKNLSLRQHVQERGERARAAFFACCGWVQRERLPLHFLERLVRIHIVPKIMWGMELAAFSPVRMRELDAWQRRIGRWLLRDFRAPDAVVLGDLGWQPWSSLAIERAASLLCRMQPSHPIRPSTAVCLYSSVQQGWAHALASRLSDAGATPPSPNDCASRCARRAYVGRSVRPHLRAQDHQRWRQRLASYTDPGLQWYAQNVQITGIPAPHRGRCAPRQAAAWCRMRHGGSTLPVHRGSRHRGASGCSLCGSPAADLNHVLFNCAALSEAREHWWRRVGPHAPAPLSEVMELSRWFCSSVCPPPIAAAHARFAWEIERSFGERI